MAIEPKIADALRTVALRLELAIESGHRDANIDANDLVETLVSIADQLAPVVAADVTPPTSLLAASRALLKAREDHGHPGRMGAAGPSRRRPGIATDP